MTNAALQRTRKIRNWVRIFSGKTRELSQTVKGGYALSHPILFDVCHCMQTRRERRKGGSCTKVSPLKVIDRIEKQEIVVSSKSKTTREEFSMRDPIFERHSLERLHDRSAARCREFHFTYSSENDRVKSRSTRCQN